MKNSRGVTLVSIVVAIVIMMIISSIGVKVGTDAYNLAKEKNFIAEMKVIQSKVDQIAEEGDYTEKYADNQATIANYKVKQIIEYPQEHNIDTNKSWNGIEDEELNNYYTFTPRQLENFLGVQNADIEVAINFKTRNVIAIDGIKVNGVRYYRQYDLEGGEKID